MNTDLRERLAPVLIAGPTASGKSALALSLADRDGGCIINADASQVYSCWRVLSARPDAADLARAPHRLFGHVGPRVRYSAGDWRREAGDAIVAAQRDGLRPIVVGGTGLYFSTLTEGLAEIPPIPAAVRARSDAMLASDPGAMIAELRRRDPETLARLDAANPMRVQRAWDVLAATGRGLAWWQSRVPGPGMATAARIVVMPETSALARRIAQRLEFMVANGVLDEVRAFLALDVPADAPSARAIGASQFTRHLRGDATLAEAVQATVIATRQLAKRQRTWLRGRMAEWTWADPATTAMLDLIPPR